MSIPNFNPNCAVLHFDLMSALVQMVRGTAAGDAFISNTKRWIDAVHQQPSPPLTIFTSLYFANDAGPELKSGVPFTQLVNGFWIMDQSSPVVQIDSVFEVAKRDIVLRKTRWYAGSGNALEQILRSQNIHSVILSGLTTSGVVLSTAYRLFDLDYKIFIISDNVIELPITDNDAVNRVAIGKIIPKMFASLITVDQAIQALEDTVKSQAAAV